MTPHLLIIGAGPGGEAAAKRAVLRGARVTLVEKNLWGGLCLNRGCIPSKALLEAGRLLHAARSAGAWLEGADSPRVRWDVLQRKKNELVDSLRAALIQNYARLGVRRVEGRAAFAGADSVEIQGAAGRERLTFDAAVLATGSGPFFPPPFDGLRDAIWDSDRALAAPGVPGRLAVVGGGAVGCEFACLFQELGARVTLIEKTGGLLPGEDPGVVRVLQSAFEARGMTVRAGTTVTAAARDGVWRLGLSAGDPLEVDEVLVCVGRRPLLSGLGIEAAGLAVAGGRVTVNEFLQTANPRVYAVGDVNGLSLLAHAAAAQGETAVDHFFGDRRAYDNSRVPRCLYTWPEVASVGDGAPAARERGVEVKTQRFFFKGSAKALASHEGEGFLQLVSDRAGGRLRGAQLVGPHATELIHVVAVALAGELTAERLRQVVFAHPTLAEGFREALSR